MIKFTILLVRKNSITREEFIAHHKLKHAKLFMSIPIVQQTVRRYIQQHAVSGEIPGMPPVIYDGITELWFDTIESLAKCFSDEQYLAKVRPDEESFLDLTKCQFVVSEENIVQD